MDYQHVFLSKIARAGLLLFWLSVPFAALSLYRLFLNWSISVHNLNSIWLSKPRMFVNQLSNTVDLLSNVVPLVPLFFFQSDLRKGCVRPDDMLIEKGLRFLRLYLLTLLVFVLLEFVGSTLFYF